MASLATSQALVTWSREATSFRPIMRIFSRRLSLLVGLAAGGSVVRGQVEIPFTKCDYDHFNIQSVQVRPPMASTFSSPMISFHPMVFL